MSPGGVSNPRPAAYKAAALPTELPGLILSSTNPNISFDLILMISNDPQAGPFLDQIPHGSI